MALPLVLLLCVTCLVGGMMIGAYAAIANARADLAALAAEDENKTPFYMYGKAYWILDDPQYVELTRGRISVRRGTRRDDSHED